MDDIQTGSQRSKFVLLDEKRRRWFRMSLEIRLGRLQVDESPARTKVTNDGGEKVSEKETHAQDQVPWSTRQRIGLQIDARGPDPETGFFCSFARQPEAYRRDVGDRDVQPAPGQPDRMATVTSGEIERVASPGEKLRQLGDGNAGRGRCAVPVLVPAVPFLPVVSGHRAPGKRGGLVHSRSSCATNPKDRGGHLQTDSRDCETGSAELRAPPLRAETRSGA